MKKLLLSLFVGFVGIISFCNAGSYVLLDTISTSNYYNFACFGSFDRIYSGQYKFVFDSAGVDQVSIGCIPTNQSVPSCDDGYCFDLDNKGLSCNELYLEGISQNCPSVSIYKYDVNVMSSLDCQIQYNLIPVEDVDINYCVGNGLCPNECGSGTDFSGDLQYSNIYINSILHPGEENIFIDIPDYIQWDYSISTGEFNIYVGSGYDMDYMNSIIKINSYRPTSSDFTNIFVSGLTLIFPYIFVLLLIVFIWKLIKRVFK